jgi:hypothetical protein
MSHLVTQDRELIHSHAALVFAVDALVSDPVSENTVSRFSYKNGNSTCKASQLANRVRYCEDLVLEVIPSWLVKFAKLAH